MRHQKLSNFAKKNFVIGEYSCQAPQNNPHNQQGQYKNMVGDMPDK